MADEGEKTFDDDQPGPVDGTPEVDYENECFFIAPIGAKGSPERRRSDGVLKFIVSRACQEVGLTAIRADQISEPGNITSQVVEHLLYARAAVADLTGLNPNVFYEIAVRHTLQLPSVLIAEEGERLPFDLVHMRTVFFDHQDLESADSAIREIVRQLKRAMERPGESPVSAVTVEPRFRSAGTAEAHMMADVVDRLDELASVQRRVSSHVDDLVSHLRPKRSPVLIDTIRVVARNMFRERGYDGVSLNQIADEIGISPDVLRHLFHGKANLYEEAVGSPWTPAVPSDRLVAEGEGGNEDGDG